MQKFISAKALYSDLKKVGEEVQSLGTIFIVLKHSKPAFKITPVEEKEPQKKYKLSDIRSFGFSGKRKDEHDLATNYKKYLYNPS